MKKTLTLLFSFSLFISINVSAQWNNVASGTAEHLYAVHCPDANTCYTAGSNGTVLKSTNAGSSWQALNTGITEDLSGVCFINNTTGVAVGVGGRIIRTTDGGTTWTVISNSDANDLRTVWFPSSTVGYVCGSGRTVLKTSDAGLTWTRQTSSGTRGYRGIYAMDVNNVVTVGYDGVLFSATTARTTNGTNWSGGATIGDAWNAVFFPTPDTGYVVGALGDLYKTYNKGVSWTSVKDTSAPALIEYFYGVYFTSTNTGYVVGMNGTIIKTTDGGESRMWDMQRYESAIRLEGVFFIDDNIGIAVGENGRIVKTTNGGNTSVADYANEHAVAIAYPNPFSEKTTIKITGTDGKMNSCSFIMFNVYGKEVKRYENLNRNNITVSGENLSQGLYFYHLINNEGNIAASGKLIISR